MNPQNITLTLDPQTARDIANAYIRMKYFENILGVVVVAVFLFVLYKLITKYLSGPFWP